MPDLHIHTLSFRGGLHIGTRGVNLEEGGVHLPSDTLFAAVLDAWRRSGGDVDAFAMPFACDPPDPPFLLTSAFPFAGDVRFYPMPVDLARVLSGEKLEGAGKVAKRIRYLSEGLLRRALGGAMLDAELFPADPDQEPTTGLALQGGAFWLLREEADGLPPGLHPSKGKLRALRFLDVTAMDKTPRVTVDRISSASTIYHAGRVSFAEGCGLWFGVAWRDRARCIGVGGPAFPEALGAALHMLAEDGIGGERAAGYGAFDLKRLEEPTSLPDPTPGVPAWLLSRYCPRADELPGALSAEGAAYRLTAVAGWMHSPDGASQRRKRVYLADEGSLVCPAAYPGGRLADVRPTYASGAGQAPHPVYRYGLALAAGWRESHG